MTTKYAWTDVDQLEDSIASGRLSGEIAARVPGLESFALSARRDAALAELLAASWASNGLLFNVADPQFAGGALGDNVTCDQAAVLATDVRVADGGVASFPRGRFVICAGISKSAYSDWQGVRGVDPGNRTVKYGSVLVAGFDGSLVSYPAAGSLFASYSGIHGVSFYSPGLGTYPNAIAVLSNGNVRQLVIEDAEIDGFNTGIAGPWGELYLKRLFIFNTKYGVLSIGMSDSWFTKVHAGSGLSAPAGTSGGAGFLLAGSNSVTLRECRGQVQKGGPGFDLRACTRLFLSTCIADQSETYGVVLVNCNQIELNGSLIFDNGLTGAKSKGVRIEALSDTFTADAASDEITITAGNASLYWAAQHCIVEFSNSGGALPTGLVAATEYYLIAGSAADKFKVAATQADAVAGNAINITAAGSGTQTIHGVTRDIRLIGGGVYDRNKGAAGEKQDVGVQIVKTGLNGTAGGKLRNITLDGVDLSRVTTPIQYTNHVDTGLRVADCQGVREDTLGASSDATYRIGEQAKNVLFNNAFAADVNITLSQDGSYGGAEFNLSRGVGATGAFNLVIKNSAGTTIATVPANATKVQMVRAIYVAGGVNQWTVYKSVEGVQDGTGDIDQAAVTGGFRQTSHGWYQDNVAASQTDVELTHAVGRFRAVRAGSVTGVVVHATEARTVGTLTIKVFKNTGLAGAAGAQLGTLTAVLDGSNTSKKATTQAKDLDTFAAGDELYLAITTDGTWAPTTSDIRAALEIED